MTLPSLEDGPDHIHSENHPNKSDQDINGPFMLGILLTGGNSEEKRERS